LHPGFSSRDALIWHVKVEHLLICPSPGCTEMSFQLRNILESHIRVAHPADWKLQNPDKPVTTPARAPPMLPTSSSQETPKPFSPRNEDEERKLKDYAITVSKRKCREQLRNVLEKRARRNGGMEHLILDFKLSSVDANQSQAHHDR
jgi:hypothetical protein